jgi:sugar fermentation stimulation protein A
MTSSSGPDISQPCPEIGSLEVPWGYLREEIQDRGSYLLILRMDHSMALDIGHLGRLTFQKGYYLYVGSAMRNLGARIQRHLRKTKKQHWHIDYLLAHTSKVIPLPIRSSQRDECEIARAISSIMRLGPPGFGSSDCHCQTHLFFSEANPLHTRAFHDVLQSFRMRHP